MTTTMKLILIAAIAVAIAALANSVSAGSLASQGLDDPHVAAPLGASEPVPCVIFTKHINHISGKLQRPDCTWKRPSRKAKRATTARPAPGCEKVIELKGGAVGIVPCDYVLGEGESE